jgi:hypothetical protein
MAVRIENIDKVEVNGVPYTVTFIDSPTIDDVVVTESRIYAAEIMNSSTPMDRRVDRDVRDILIRLGVER